MPTASPKSSPRLRSQLESEEGDPLLTEKEVFDLVTGARQGDQEAAASLIDFVHPFVMKIIHRRCPTDTTPEDLAQDVFLRIFKYLDKFRGQGEFLHWVSKITYNTCLSGYRSARFKRNELCRSDLSEAQLHVLELTVADEVEPDAQQRFVARELLSQLLAQLPPKDRLILEMRELEQRSYDEISQVTGWSNVNIRVRATRAKKKLRSIWTQLLESESSP